jgi:hypothetical protein
MEQILARLLAEMNSMQEEMDPNPKEMTTKIGWKPR